MTEKESNHKQVEKGSKPHITQDQLEKELMKGKPQKQIAHEYGYGHPSRRLNEKIRELGFTELPSISLDDPTFLPPKMKEVMVERAGLGDAENVFLDFSVSEGGRVCIEPVEQKWVKEDDEA